MITFPYQLEAREGAGIIFTDGLLKGLNPYVIENLPYYYNTYGIVYYLIAAPFVKLFGSPFVIHRLVSGFFLLLNMFMVYKILKKENVPLLLNLAGVLLFQISLLNDISISSRPGMTAMFFFLLCLYFALYSNFSRKGLLFCTLFGLLAFLSKIYFILCWLLVAVYMFLFISKRKAILFSAFSGICLIITMTIIGFTLPYYLPNSILGAANYQVLVLGHLFNQLSLIGYEYLPLIVIVLSYYLSIDRLKYLTKIVNIKLLLPLNSPLLNLKPNFYLFCLITNFTLFCLKFGQHHGAFLTYLKHLVIPFLIIVSILCIHKVVKSNYKLAGILFPILIVSFFYSYDPVAYSKNMNKPYMANYKKIEKVIASDKKIYCIPSFNSIMLKHNKKIYDTGQTEYFVYSYIPQKLKWLIPQNQATRKYFQYDDNIKELIANQYFDIIIFRYNNDFEIHKSYVEKYYDTYEIFMVKMGLMADYNVVLLMKPKPDRNISGIIQKPAKAEETNDRPDS